MLTKLLACPQQDLKDPLVVAGRDAATGLRFEVRPKVELFFPAVGLLTDVFGHCGEDVPRTGYALSR